LEAYTDSVDFQGGETFSKHVSTISQRSSFDNSLDNMLSNGMMQIEVSPGKIGEGLFPVI